MTTKTFHISFEYKDNTSIYSEKFVNVVIWAKNKKEALKIAKKSLPEGTKTRAKNLVCSELKKKRVFVVHVDYEYEGYNGYDHRSSIDYVVEAMNLRLAEKKGKVLFRQDFGWNNIVMIHAVEKQPTF